MAKAQKSDKDKIQDWVKFHNDLYQQPPQQDYSLEEWHEWYKENKLAIDTLVAEEADEAKKLATPEVALIPKAPNAVASKRQKTAFEAVVEKNTQEAKELAAEEVRLVRKFGNDYRSTKYEPLLEALNEYDTNLPSN